MFPFHVDNEDSKLLKDLEDELGEIVETGKDISRTLKHNDDKGMCFV